MPIVISAVALTFLEATRTTPPDIFECRSCVELEKSGISWVVDCEKEERIECGFVWMMCSLQ